MNGGEDITLACSLIAAAGAILAAVLTVHGNRYSKQTNDQVANDHDTNLREDLDAIAELVADGFRETKRDIGGLRQELRTERQERIEGDKRAGREAR